MEPRSAPELKDSLDILLGPNSGTGSGGGNSGEANMPRQQRLPRVLDAVTVGKDAIALGHVAKQIAKMSPEGQRAAVCWLVGYLESDVSNE